MPALLREERLRAGLSQTQLADKLGRRPIHISRYERGARRPSLDAVANLAAAIGCEPGAFFGEVAE